MLNIPFKFTVNFPTAKAEKRNPKTSPINSEERPSRPATDKIAATKRATNIKMNIAIAGVNMKFIRNFCLGSIVNYVALILVLNGSFRYKNIKNHNPSIVLPI